MTLGLLLTILLQLGIATALTVSVVQFAIRQTVRRRRNAAVASASALLLVMSIYYARSLAETAKQIALDRAATGAQPSQPWMLVHDWIIRYYDFWMARLAWVSEAANPAFAISSLPAAVVLTTYLFRSGVYRFARDRYPRLNQATSAYWVHMTMWLVSLVAVRAFYGLGPLMMTLIVIATLTVAFTGLTGVLGDVGAAIGWMWRVAIEVSGLLWKWLTVAAIKTMKALRALRTQFDAIWAAIKRPVVAIASKFEETIQTSSARAEAIMAADEVREPGDPTHGGTPPHDLAA